MNKKLYKLLMLGLLAGLVLCAFFVGSYFKESVSSQKNFESLKDIMGNDSAESEHGQSFEDLYGLNHDLVGWIRIEGTTLDYPVMQTKSDPEYYLYRDFYQANSSHGVPFADAQCDINPPSDNIIIYGHHMRDGSMFAALVNYTSESYYIDHQIIKFDTIHTDETGEYRVIAAFTSQVNTGNSGEYPFYSYINLGSEEEFQTFYKDIKHRSIYETGVTAQYGDKFITLATCEYSQNSSRMVIVAVKCN